MFLQVLSWMLANTPSFMRPGVSWLVDGLRRITGHIANLWNALGSAVGFLFMAIANWRGQLASFAVIVSNGFWWVRNVYIPARLNALLSQVIGLINQSAAWVHNAAVAAVANVQRWMSDQLYGLGQWIGSVIGWVLNQVERIDAFLMALIRALLHVMSGPVVLAEWLIGALWQASLRRLYAERDRIFEWVLSRSTSFAVWLARMIEDMIVRML